MVEQPSSAGQTLRRRFILVVLGGILFLLTEELLLGGVLIGVFWPRHPAAPPAVALERPSPLDSLDPTRLTEAEWPSAVRDKQAVGVLKTGKGADTSLRVEVEGNGVVVKTAWGEEVVKINSPDVRAAAFSPDGHLFVTGGANEANVWEVQPKALLRRGAIAVPNVASVAFAPDGGRVAVVTAEGVQLWDVRAFRPGWSGERLRTLLLSTGLSCAAVLVVLLFTLARLRPAKWLRRGCWAAGLGCVIALGWWTCHWVFSGAALLYQPDGGLQHAAAREVCFAPDGKSLAVLEFGRLSLYDAAVGCRTGSWLIPEGVQRPAFAPDGRHLLALTTDKAFVLRLKPFDDNAYLLACCEDVLKQEPESVDALVARGQARLRQGRAEGALADFNAALRLDPENAMAYYYRGQGHTDKGDYSQARADFAEAVRLDPALAPKSQNGKKR